MSLEMILGAIGLIVAAIASAFGLGHLEGSGKAEADKQRTEENAAAVSVAAARRVEATKGSADVQQTVNNLHDDASCVNRGVSPPAVTDTVCDRVQPIDLSDHDINVMDMQTRRAVLVLNQTWQKNCVARK